MSSETLEPIMRVVDALVELAEDLPGVQGEGVRIKVRDSRQLAALCAALAWDERESHLRPRVRKAATIGVDGETLRWSACTGAIRGVSVTLMTPVVVTPAMDEEAA